jgi:hypothetical protein
MYLGIGNRKGRGFAKMATARRIAAGAGMIIGPLGLLAGWVVLMQRPRTGPNIEWFLSHWLLIAGAVFMVPAIIGFRHLLGDHAGAWSDVGAGLAWLGALALVGQFAIDLAVGELSADQASMSASLRRVSSAPGISIPFHVVGPLAFYIGLLMLVILLYRFRVIPAWAATLAGVGIVAVGVGSMTGIAGVTLLGFAGMCAGFIPTGWRVLTRSQAGM